MSLLYRKMRENEKKMEKYQFATKSTRPVIDLIKKDGKNETKNEDESMPQLTLNTSDASGTSRGDGWKKLRNSSKRDNEGWKKLRQSGATTKSSLYQIIEADADIEAQSSDVPTARTPTNADARDEAKSSNEVENRVSFLAESKGVIASLDVELNQTIDEELAMTEDFCPNMKEDPTLSLVEALDEVQIDYEVEGKRTLHRVRFEAVSDPVSNTVTSSTSSGKQRGLFPHEKKNTFFSLSESMTNWSFLSRFPSFTRTEVDDNNDASALGLSKAALTKKKQLYLKASKSRQIAIQGMLYVVAFYITWFFPTLQRITELAVSKNFFVLQFFDTFLLPLQGKYGIDNISIGMFC